MKYLPAISFAILLALFSSFLFGYRLQKPTPEPTVITISPSPQPTGQALSTYNTYTTKHGVTFNYAPTVDNGGKIEPVHIYESGVGVVAYLGEKITSDVFVDRTEGGKIYVYPKDTTDTLEQAIQKGMLDNPPPSQANCRNLVTIKKAQTPASEKQEAYSIVPKCSWSVENESCMESIARGCDYLSGFVTTNWIGYFVESSNKKLLIFKSIGQEPSFPSGRVAPPDYEQWLDTLTYN